jgi:anti-anti-sigma factor
MATYELAQGESGDPTVVVLEVGGELDLTNSREVEERLKGLFGTNGSYLILDLNRVVFIDSAALHVLFRTARRLGKERFGVAVEPTAPIAQTLAIVGISDVATVAASTDDLLAALTPSV